MNRQEAENAMAAGGVPDLCATHQWGGFEVRLKCRTCAVCGAQLCNEGFYGDREYFRDPFEHQRPSYTIPDGQGIPKSSYTQPHELIPIGE